MDSFYVTLPSDSSLDIYPQNGPAKYTTALKQGIGLVGDYEVALTEIQFKFDFHNFVSEKLSFEVLVDEDDFEKLVTVDEKYFELEAMNRTDNVVLQFYKLYDELYSIVHKTVIEGDWNPVYQQSVQKHLLDVKQMVSYTDGKTLQSVDQWLFRRKNKIEEANHAIRIYVYYIANMKNLSAQESTRTGQIMDQLRDLVVVVSRMQKRVDRMNRPDDETAIIHLRDKRDANEEEPVAEEESAAESIPTSATMTKSMTTTIVQAVTPRSSELVSTNEAEKVARTTKSLLSPNLNPITSLLSPNTNHISQDGAALMAALNQQLTGLREAITALPIGKNDDNDALVLKSSKVYLIVPPSILPSVVENDKRIFRIPVNFPSGYYKDPHALVTALNAELRYACVVRNMDKFVYFKYDPRADKISVYMHEKVAVKFTDKTFAEQIGFESAKLDPIIRKNMVGDKTVIYHQLWQLMYIYSDVADYSHVGNSMSQLLRVMPVIGSANEYTVVRFDAPHYVPVIKNSFSTLEVQLANEFGDDYSIKSGKTIIKLHFRPRVKNIF